MYLKSPSVGIHGRMTQSQRCSILYRNRSWHLENVGIFVCYVVHQSLVVGAIVIVDFIQITLEECVRAGFIGLSSIRLADFYLLQSHVCVVISEMCESRRNVLTFESDLVLAL